MKKIVLTGHNLTLDEVVLAARGYRDLHGDHHYPVVVLSNGADNINKNNPRDNARERILNKRRGLEERIKAGDIIYGVNTGCGIRKGMIIPEDEIIAYQKHYIPAHCVQTGDYFPEEVVRLAMVLRVNSFATGYSAMSLEACEKLLEFYNLGIIPCVPEQGSVGSSGDLAPLAHVAAAITGLKGQSVSLPLNALTPNQKNPMPVAEALEIMNVTALVLRAKEAMGLTNGSTFTLAIGLLAIHDAKRLFKFSDLAAALSLEAIRGELAAFDPRLIGIRNHEGAKKVAETIRKMVAGSKRMTKEAQDICLPYEKKTKKYMENDQPAPRVQDAYSFRAYPPVAGSAYEALWYAERVFLNEINAATDNPLIFEKENGGYEALSGGNFHGEPLGQAADFLKIALAQLANISDRRFYALSMTATSYGLPGDLAGQTNDKLNTGLMIAQYTTASLVSENKTLCHPSVVDSIPTSANQEDYVSMATNSARHLAKVLKNSYRVIAWELIAAAQGISLTEAFLKEQGYGQLGEKTGAAYKVIREHIAVMDDDRILCVDLSQMVALMDGSELLAVIR